MNSKNGMHNPDIDRSAVQILPHGFLLFRVGRTVYLMIQIIQSTDLLAPFPER
jgi:hypothetical protein